MFAAGGMNAGFGGLYKEDVDAAGGDTRHTLGAADALRCALFTGPAIALLGVFFLVRAGHQPRGRLDGGVPLLCAQLNSPLLPLRRAWPSLTPSAPR